MLSKSKVLTAKVAAAAVLVLGVGSAAAATGSLPDAAQDGLSKAASHVGIELPTSAGDQADTHATTSDDETTTTTTEADTNEVKAADDTAAAEQGPTADNHGADVSDVARNTTAEGRDKGEAVSTAARDNHGHATTTTTAGSTTADESATTPDHPTADDHPTAEGHPTKDDHPGKP